MGIHFADILAEARVFILCVREEEEWKMKGKEEKIDVCYETMNIEVSWEC